MEIRRNQRKSSGLGTRGITPGKLTISKIWWSCPDWLTKDPKEWPTEKENVVKINLQTQDGKNFLNMLETKFISFKKLIRVIAYVRRFLSICKKKGNQERLSANRSLSASRNRITDSQIKREVWINGLKNAVKRIIHRCTKCTGYRQSNTE